MHQTFAHHHLHAPDICSSLWIDSQWKVVASINRQMYSLTEMIHNCFVTGKAMATQANKYLMFGSYLRKTRIEKGLGLRELARRIDISHTYLSQLERGEPRNLSAEKLIRLADVLAQHQPYELFAKAGQLPSEVEEIIKDDLELWSRFVLETKALTAGELRGIVDRALATIRQIAKVRARLEKDRRAKVRAQVKRAQVKQVKLKAAS
jgi:transcriptional regulator with XRE-family HTH domain